VELVCNNNVFGHTQLAAVINEQIPLQKLDATIHVNIYIISDIHSSCIFLDFNQSYDNVNFQCTETTDQYRPGLPYKLLHYPLKSSVQLVFSVTDFDFLSEVQLQINCCTGQHYHGKVDILVNNLPFIMSYTGTYSHVAFREHSFSIPKDLIATGDNSIKIQLSEGSPGVFWLSDVRITGIFHVK
jgi:hypothetical protein